jgi:hypothetical protein
MVSYRSAVGIYDSPSSQGTYEKYIIPSGYAGGPTIFLRRQLREGNHENFSLREFRLSNYATPQASSKKRIQASDPEDTTLPAPTVEYEFHPQVRRAK